MITIPMRESEQRKLRQLVSRMVDGIATPKETAELEAMLLANRSARDHYRNLIALHSELERHPRLLLQKTIHCPRIKPVRLVLAIAAVVALAAVALWQATQTPASEAPLAENPAPSLAPLPTPHLAMVAASENLVAADPTQPALEVGSMIGAGTLHYVSGTLSLNYFWGAQMTLSAPFELEILNSRAAFLHHGQLAARVANPGFVLRVPNGAVIDHSAEFSVNVGDSGMAAVAVYHGVVEVSRIGSSGNTREAVRLQRNGAIIVGKRFKSLPVSALSGFIRQTNRVIPPLQLNPDYPDAVMASKPLGYWRFETVEQGNRITNETGGSKLILKQRASIAGSKGSRFLYTNTTNSAGFAEIDSPLDRMNDSDGCTLELWYYSETNHHGTIAVMTQAGPVPQIDPKLKVHHAPGLLLLERMGLSGSKIGHLHPHFSVRYLFRSPPGYIGGTNSYSRESHLLNRWVHIAAVRTEQHLRLFVDGQISDEIEINLPFDDSSYNLLLARLHSLNEIDQRQWVGGIDEVAVYQRALSASEIERHYQAASSTPSH